MPIIDFMVQSADVSTEPRGVDSLGGADRSGEWSVVAAGAPCLVRPMSASIVTRDGARRNVTMYRIYFRSDPVDGGIGTRHRVTVDGRVYQVTGAVNPNSLGRLIHVDCEAIINT